MSLYLWLILIWICRPTSSSHAPCSGWVSISTSTPMSLTGGFVTSRPSLGQSRRLPGQLVLGNRATHSTTSFQND